MKVRATSKKVLVTLHQTANGFWGEAYKSALNFTTDNLPTELSVNIAVSPGRRTYLAEVLAFWATPTLEGRPAPVQVQIASASSPVPAGLTGNLVRGREIVDWNVDAGAQPLFRAKLPRELAAFLLATDAVELTVEPAGMSPVAFSTASAGLKAAYEKGEALRETLRSKGIDPEACKDTTEGCFLTTACCAALGRPDDCFELETLRHFRSRHLQNNAAGRGLLDEYARISPALVRAIGSSSVHADGSRIPGVLLVVYLACIVPCVMMVRLGLVRAPVWLYRTTVTILRRRYLASRI